ncbi:Phenylacetic acid degradation operon negative regulatory protein paaX [Cedecea neteri]|uniref:Phenylacetic acid degradation operon negative regulatory protein paaX n=1 Tax=Cedecea neteri TaxID=158822 RepID=A0A2X3JEJ0_9ENTR|nr:Phenylacetic acid degradation operon negative regulatory protein paaX [Cedecea neteri]
MRWLIAAAKSGWVAWRRCWSLWDSASVLCARRFFRLNKEGWLDVERVGRRSFYRLTDMGQRMTRRAESKIYRAGQPAWDGKWLLLLSEGWKKLRCNR